MPFRAKAKNFFKSSSKTRDSSLSKTSSDDDDGVNHDVYKPGEAMPPPKYRRPPQKEHTEKLESFSFADAWRKKSFQSSHSPMGTRAHSRRASMMSTGRRSRKSVASLSDTAKTGSVSYDEDAGARTRDAVAVAVPRLATEPELEGDDDVANVGLSRVQSKEKGVPSRPKTADNSHANALHKTMSTAHDHHPFSEQDVARALQRSQLQVAAH